MCPPDYFYLEVVRDYRPAAEGQSVEGMEMNRGDLLRVYRVTSGECFLVKKLWVHVFLEYFFQEKKRVLLIYWCSD